MSDSHTGGVPIVSGSRVRAVADGLPERFASALIHATALMNQAFNAQYAFEAAARLAYRGEMPTRWLAETVECLTRIDENRGRGEGAIFSVLPYLIRHTQLPRDTHFTNAHEAGYGYTMQTRGAFDRLVRTASGNRSGLGSEFRPPEELLRFWPDVVGVIHAQGRRVELPTMDCRALEASLIREATDAAKAWQAQQHEERQLIAAPASPSRLRSPGTAPTPTPVPTPAATPAEPITQTEQEEDWNAIGAMLILQHRDKLKSLTDLHRLLKQKGYPNSRGALYKLPGVIAAATAAEIYKPKKSRKDANRPPKGVKKTDGSVEAPDYRTGTE
jgi:hypothetical protein